MALTGEPTSRSIDEAIAHARDHLRAERAEADSAVLRGKTITAFSWAPESVSLILEDGLELDIFAGPASAVGWSIGPPGAERSDPADPDPIRVCLSLGSGPPLAYVWDRAGLARERQGQPIDQVFAGPRWFYLYVKGAPILLFNTATAEGGERWLLWDETD